MYIVPFHQITPDQQALVGGKALNLGRLTLVGVDVPPGFVITTEAYRQFIGRDFPPVFAKELETAFAALKTQRVAVRSSAVAEDGAETSWAGQFATFLDVTEADLETKLQDCWASVASTHAAAYGKKQTVMAVVVQRMIASDIAGVLFTANPVTGSADEIVIEAVYGLGELLVQGTAIPDSYILNKKTGEVITSEIGPKSHMLVYEHGQHISKEVVANKQTAPALSSTQLHELAAICQAIEIEYGYPLDIEWAYYKDQLYILQARPITTLQGGIDGLK